ncbi:MAG: hypothetical protein NZ809_01515 [Thermodesulfovibrio sp.]|nr:hypothetical protein [Thermodesulfovibrio sp.]
MKINTLAMIHKIKQWEEEIKRERFLQILAEMRKIETYLNELELRFKNNKFEFLYSSEQLKSIFYEIEYTAGMLKEAKKTLNELSLEVEKNRIDYEEAYIERKKTEQLLEKLLENLKLQREKLEERLILENFINFLEKQK